MIDWDAIQKEFETTAISLVDLAEKHDIKYPTIKSRKQRKGWQKQTNPKAKKNASKIKRKVQSKDAIKFDEIENLDLTEKQQLFCLYYIKNHNAALAVIKAGYNVSNTQRAAEVGYQLLHNHPVRKEYERLKKLQHQSIMLDPEDILLRMMQIGLSDMTDIAEWGTELIPDIDSNGNALHDDNGNVKMHKRNYLEFKNSDQVDGALICEVSLGRQGMKVKMEDRQRALIWLADYFNTNPMNKHKVEYDNAILKLREKELKLKGF